MQTFLPYDSFVGSMKVLDYKRLGKQRVECKQLLSALGYEIAHGRLQPKADTGKAGWKNHPCAKMWKSYEHALAVYMAYAVNEWTARGYNNTMETLGWDLCYNPIMPPWFGREELHASHRSNLLRKDPEYYGKFGWSEPDDLPYIWPA